MLDYFQNLIANCASKWRPVVGYEGLYEVSSDGEVRSLLRRVAHGRHKDGQIIGQRTLKIKPGKLGYKIASLCRDGLPCKAYVHRLVVESHRGAIPDGLVIDHANGDKSDNRLVNLRVVKQSQNVKNKISTGNAHGHRGIILAKDGRHKKWHAAIQINGKKVLAGSFYTKEEAIAARISAELKYWGDDAPSVVRK